MLHFILNYKSVHDCVDYLKTKGFHDNSFIIGPLYTPEYLNALNLPEPMLQEVIATLKSKLNLRPIGYLKNSYENLISYYTSTAWNKDIKSFYDNLGVTDKRRGIDSKITFNNLYKELDAYTLE